MPIKNAHRPSARAEENPRRHDVLETVKDAGLLAGPRGHIAARIRKKLVKAAKARSGINSDTDLLESFVRLLRLLDCPRDPPVLGPMAEREVLWRLINGPHKGRWFARSD